MRIYIIYLMFVILSLGSFACFFEDEPDPPSSFFFNLPGWTPISNYPYHASLASGFGIESLNKAYVGITYRIADSIPTGPNSSTRDGRFFEYDPTIDKWTRKQDFPDKSRYSAVSFSIGNKGYIVTGTDGDTSIFPRKFWEYDPLKDKWESLGDFPGEPRFGAVGLSIGNKGYVGFGLGKKEKEFSDFWEYDPATKTWEEQVSWKGSKDDRIFPRYRYTATAFSIDEKGYIVAGSSSFGSDSLEVWEFNPKADFKNRWRLLKDSFPGGVQGGAAFSIGGKGYVCCGKSGGALSRKLWEFDPIQEKWKQVANFSGLARIYPVGFSLNNKGYVGTGQFTLDYNLTNFLSDFFVYSLDSKK